MRKKAPKGWIKISDFEELTGISSKTIAAAVKRGYMPREIADRVGVSATSPYYLNPRQAAKHWYGSINAAHPTARQVREKLSVYIKTFDREFVTERKEVDGKQTKITYEDAQLQEKIAKAEMADLELEEKRGNLVSREQVSSQLFAAGQQLRNALLAIPDRITDEVIAEADNRHKVHSILYDAIVGELQKLVDIQKAMGND